MSENKQPYLVTARKWRPLTFNEVVGQEHISTTLKNAIKTGRIHHALLFCGPRGVGKTTTARIYARAVNFPELIDKQVDNPPEEYKAILNGSSLDIIEIDGASNNSVDDIRKLRESSKYPPSTLKYKMYIIDEVHMLSTSAFNALLKTLEEPPEHLLFVFATTESHKLPATIISRCQRYDFRRIEIEDIYKQLHKIAESEKITFDERALLTVAKKADGSMRDAQSIFDQAVAFCGTNVQYSDLANALHLIDEELFFTINNHIKDNNLSELFKITAEIVNKGYDLQEVMQGLLEHYRNIAAIKLTGDVSLVQSAKSTIEKYKELADSYSIADLINYMSVTASAEYAIKYSPQPRIKFELTLSQLSMMGSSKNIAELIDGLAELKKKPELIGAIFEDRTPNPAPLKIQQTQTIEAKKFNPIEAKKADIIETKKEEVQNTANHEEAENTFNTFSETDTSKIANTQITEVETALIKLFDARLAT